MVRGIYRICEFVLSNLYSSFRYCIIYTHTCERLHVNICIVTGSLWLGNRLPRLFFFSSVGSLLLRKREYMQIEAMLVCCEKIIFGKSCNIFCVV